MTDRIHLYLISVLNLQTLCTMEKWMRRLSCYTGFISHQVRKSVWDVLQHKASFVQDTDRFFPNLVSLFSTWTFSFPSTTCSLPPPTPQRIFRSICWLVGWVYFLVLSISLAFVSFVCLLVSIIMLQFVLLFFCCCCCHCFFACFKLGLHVTKVFVCSCDWPWTPNFSAYTSRMLGLQSFTTTLNPICLPKQNFSRCQKWRD